MNNEVEYEFELKDNCFILKNDVTLKEGCYIETVCMNENCKTFQKPSSWNKLRCPNCSKETIKPITVKQEFNEPFDYEAPQESYGSFKSFANSTQQAKKSKLKDRSHAHFDRVIKERKHEMDKGRMSGMRD